jgi:phage I-like protein
MASGVQGTEEVVRIVAATVSLQGEVDGVISRLPGRILLVPWGWVRSTNGDFLVDEAGAAAVLHEFQRHATDLVIDYEHQSLGGRYASPSGLAPAAGWVTSLEIDPGVGIWGQVRWTPAAARRVLRREYRFLSPVVIVHRENRKVMALDSAALTNRPAIAGMRSVLQQAKEAQGMAREQVGSQEGGQQANQAQAGEVTMQEQCKQLRLLLSLDGQVEQAEVMRQACSRLTDLLEQARQREAQERVSCAMQAGKVCEAQKEWAARYALRDLPGFEEWVRQAPVLVPLQRVAPEMAGVSSPAPSTRRTMVAAARSEWKSNVLLQRLTGERAYVEEVLQQAGEDPLGEQEVL